MKLLETACHLHHVCNFFSHKARMLEEHELLLCYSLACAKQRCEEEEDMGMDWHVILRAVAPLASAPMPRFF